MTQSNKYKEITLEEQKRIEVQILDDVVNFCNKNNIDYFLTGGTLLGAIRHKGFIPWDDDIDIAMPRDSYELFIASYHSLNDFRIITAYNNNQYYLPWAKVVYNRTSLYEKVYKPVELGVNIDVFPMDLYFTKNKAENIYKKIMPYKKLLHYKYVRIQTEPKRGLLLQMMVFFFHLLTAPISRNYLARKIDNICRSESSKEGSYMAAMVAMTYGIREIIDVDAILPIDSYEMFERNYYRCPHSPDTFLTNLYGDYMKLPTKEKRITHHMFNAYWK